MNISSYPHMNIRMTSRGKRPLRNLTPSDKVRAIQRIHNGETKASVSRDIGVPESTLRGWCKNEQKLRFMCRQININSNEMSDFERAPVKRAKLIELTSPDFSKFTNLEDIKQNQLPYGELTKNKCSTEEVRRNSLRNVIKPNLQDLSKVISCQNDFHQLNILHNTNMLSLLGSNFKPLTDNAEPDIDAINLSNIPESKSRKCNIIGNTLTVKSWAKDPAVSLEPEIISNATKFQYNFNNKEINQKWATSSINEADVNFVHSDAFANSLRSFTYPAVSSVHNETNAALFEWCKVFNASLNFIALAAAAAALNPSTNENLSENLMNIDASDELVKHIKKTNGIDGAYNNLAINNDVSNDSCFDSEPEDLSARSISSTNTSSSTSRSDSPAKSCGTLSFSLHSDVEQ